MTYDKGERQKHMRKGTRSIIFGAAILIGLATYKMASQVHQLQDFAILIGLVIGATVFALLRQLLL